MTKLPATACFGGQPFEKFPSNPNPGVLDDPENCDRLPNTAQNRYNGINAASCATTATTGFPGWPGLSGKEIDQQTRRDGRRCL